MVRATDDETKPAHSHLRAGMDTVGHGLLVGLDTVFLDPVQLDRPRTDEHLLALVETHILAEAGDLEVYRELARSHDPVTAELMRLLVEDEERHHALLQRLALSLQDDLNWERSEGALPAERSHVDAGGPRALEQVKQAIQHEHKGARHLNRLAREAGDLRRGLAALLLKTMAMDSQKHETVLRHIAGRLEHTR